MTSDVALFWIDARRVLEKDEYQLLRMYYRYGYRLEEIGEILGLSAVAVRKRIKKTVEKLKRELGE